MSSDSDMNSSIPSSIAEITTSLFLGFILNSFLFGIVCVQAYNYYLAFPGDRIHHKALVAILFLMQVFQTVASLVDGFRWFGRDYGNMDELDRVGLIWFTFILWGPQIALVTQCVYAWRIWLLSQTIWVPVVVTVLAFFQGGVGSWAGVLLFKTGRFSIQNKELGLATALWLGSTTATDIVIAVSMITILLRGRAGLKSTTDARVVRLVAHMIETGAVTAAVALADLALYHKFPTTNYHMPACFVLSKAYTISFYAILNSRMTSAQRQNHLNDIELGGGTLNGIRFSSAPSAGMHSKPIARATLSYRSKTCRCECHLNSVDDSTVELYDDPEFLKSSRRNEECGNDV